MQNVPSPSSMAIPAAIAALIRAGKLPAAEQRLLQLLAGRPDTERALPSLEMAEAWAARGDAPHARRWLERIPRGATAFHALRVARLAIEIGEPLLAHSWFEWALIRDETLTDEDRLQHGLSVLTAAERMRIRHGRQGSWQRHLALLRTSVALLGGLVERTTHVEIAQRAAAGRDRAQRLLGPGGSG